VSKAPTWCVHAKEYSTRLAGRAIATQVGGQSFPYIRREGQPVVKQSLASNENFAGSPIDVLELQADHFPGAKAKTSQ
jgi:hypothetical protein